MPCKWTDIALENKATSWQILLACSGENGHLSRWLVHCKLKYWSNGNSLIYQTYYRRKRWDEVSHSWFYCVSCFYCVVQINRVCFLKLYPDLARILLVIWLKEKSKYVTIPTVIFKLNFGGNVATMFTLRFLSCLKTWKEIPLHFSTLTFRHSERRSSSESREKSLLVDGFMILFLWNWWVSLAVMVIAKNVQLPRKNLSADSWRVVKMSVRCR